MVLKNGELFPMLIEDMKRALDANCYMSALAIALTIPDICGAAECGVGCKNKKRYTCWYNEWIGACLKEGHSENDIPTPYLSGDVLYSLRCSFLHSGNPGIEEKASTEDNRIDRFILEFEEKNEYDAYGDSATTWSDGTQEYTVNVRKLCQDLAYTGLRYYEQYKQKFDFFNFEIQKVNFQKHPVVVETISATCRRNKNKKSGC